MARTRTPPITAFAERLGRARTHAGLTQADVCAELELSQGTLSGLEIRGEGTNHLMAFARLYGVDPYWLYNGEGLMVAKGKTRDGNSALSADAASLAERIDGIRNKDKRQRALGLCSAILDYETR